MSNKTVLQLPSIAEINKEKERAFIYAGLEATEFFPEEDRKIPYSDIPGTVHVVQSNINAKLDALYHTVATCTITDPTPFEGKGYVVRVINGTTTIAGSDYTPGQIVVRTFHSGSWETFVYDVNGKLLSSTEADYTNATTPLNIDDKAIVFQGGTPRLVNVSELGGSNFEIVRCFGLSFAPSAVDTWFTGNRNTSILTNLQLNRNLGTGSTLSISSFVDANKFVVVGRKKLNKVIFSTRDSNGNVDIELFVMCFEITPNMGRGTEINPQVLVQDIVTANTGNARMMFKNDFSINNHTLPDDCGIFFALRNLTNNATHQGVELIFEFE